MDDPLAPSRRVWDGAGTSHNWFRGGSCARLIENGCHWVRDVVLGEDACRVRTGAASQVLCGLRNTVLYVPRATGLVRIAEALRHLAARPDEAVQRVMQPLPTEL